MGVFVRIACVVLGVVAGTLGLGVARAQQCTPGMRFGPQARQCRTEPPPFLTTRIGIDASLGAWDRDVGVDHAAAGFGIPIDLRIVGPLWLGARAQYTVGGDGGRDADGDGFDDDNTQNPKVFVFAGGPRLVLDTEPARREAWRFGLSAGVLVPLNGGESGPVIEAAVERQWGSLRVDHEEGPPTHGTGTDFSLGVRAQQGLADASDYRSLMLTATYATEMFVELPSGEAPPRSRPDVEHTSSMDLLVGTGFGAGGLAQGVGLAFGLPLTRVLEPRLRTDAVFFTGTDAHEGAFVYSALVGLRLSRWYLPWIELLAGYGHAFGTQPTAVASGLLAEVAMGGQFPNALGCGYGITIGQRVRFGFEEGDRRLVALLFAIGVSYDSLVRASECWP